MEALIALNVGGPEARASRTASIDLVKHWSELPPPARCRVRANTAAFQGDAGYRRFLRRPGRAIAPAVRRFQAL